MKKTIYILIFILMIYLAGCSQKNNDENEEAKDFIINDWVSSMGSINEDSVDNFDEQKYSYTFNLTSQTGKLDKVKEINPVFDSHIEYIIINNELPQIEIKDDYIEIQGYVILNTSGLTKEEILELEPFINSFKIIIEDDIEYTLELNY